MDKNNLWTTSEGGFDNVNAQTDAAGLQGVVDSPYAPGKGVTAPDPQVSPANLQDAANKVLASSSTAAANPIPCGDTAGYYKTAMHDYHQAAVDALAGNYGQASYLLRQGADAMTWLESESIGIGYITGPQADYGPS